MNELYVISIGQVTFCKVLQKKNTYAVLHDNILILSNNETSQRTTEKF